MKYSFFKILMFSLMALVALSLGGCYYENYGVDKEKYKLPYRTYYHGEKDKNIDFYTVIFSTVDKPRGAYNYIDFNVSISHMNKDIQHKNKGRYVSSLNFNDFTTDDNIILIPESIQLIHKKTNGEIIPFEKAENDFSRQTSSKYRSHYYRQVYDPTVLPDKIKEFIYLEVVVDGVKRKIEYEFTIEKSLHYTWWDIMMGI